jgi:hypothetical protein
MEGILLGIAVLACPIGMGLMMWFMARGMKGKRDDGAPASLETLREEHRRLGDEISRVEQADDRTSRSPS